MSVFAFKEINYFIILVLLRSDSQTASYIRHAEPRRRAHSDRRVRSALVCSWAILSRDRSVKNRRVICVVLPNCPVLLRHV